MRMAISDRLMSLPEDSLQRSSGEWKVRRLLYMTENILMCRQEISMHRQLNGRETTELSQAMTAVILAGMTVLPVSR